jgi:hypothetical protein
MLQSCSNKGNDTLIIDSISEMERSTCEVWVDHFSLDFRQIDERKWLYTQQQPSLGGTLKVYELTAEPQYNLWTLTETKMTVGQKEATESKPLAERKVWSWKNWDSYEISDQCRFMSHGKIQFE